jgi:hypothetical protein
MNHKLKYLFTSVASLGVACAGQSLYYSGDAEKESLPLKWTVGSNVIFDNNLIPTIPSGQVGSEENAVSISPYAQVTLTNVSPQTTIDLYARVGVIYFLTESDVPAADDTFPSARVGFDVNHNFNSRVRFTSRNSYSYEFEPDYSQGLSAPRGQDPYTLWSSDNSVGYRFSERFGSYTGFTIGGLDSAIDIASRFTWDVYEQLRYQLDKRTVLTGGYRYSQWSGDQQDSTNHFITGGLEHRFSKTSIMLANAGIQLRDVDGTDDAGASPFFEVAVDTKLNSRASVKSFTRYSVEDFDTVQSVGGNSFQYANQQVLRIGINGSYSLTPRLSLFGGVDYINTAFDDGTELVAPFGKDSGKKEDVLNLSLGLRAKINPALTGECVINFTDSSSDFKSATFTRDFDRTRISAGVNYTF